MLKIQLLEGSADSLTLNDNIALNEAFIFTYQRFKELAKPDTTYLKNRASFFAKQFE